MAIALLGSIASGGDSGGISHTLAAGSDRIVIGVSVINPGNQTPTATYGGETMTKAVDLSFDSNTRHVVIFYILEADLPSNGANTYDPTNGNDRYHACLAFSGVDQAVPDDTASADQGYGHDEVCVQGTATENGSLFISVMGGDRDGGDTTHGSGQTEFVEHYNDNTVYITATYEIQATAAAENMCHENASSAARGQVVAVFAPAAGGDPEAGLVGGKLINGGLLMGGLLVR